MKEKRLTKTQEALIAASTIPFVPRAERGALASRREIMCRGCGRWMTMNADDRRWYYTDSGELACLDPETLKPYNEEKK